MVGLIGISIFILVILVLFSVILGSNFIGGVQTISIDNSAIVNGSTTTFVYPTESFTFFIDTTALVSASITLLTVIIAVALVAGANLLSSGLNPQGTRFVVFLTGYIGIWIALTILAFNLIITIQIFGQLIYITLTIAYVIGVVQKISQG